MKKILAILLALTMIISLGMTVWAADDDGDGLDDETGEPVAADATEDAATGTIIIKNATKGHTYTAYKIFDATYTGEGEDAKVSYTTPAANESLLDDTLFDWSEPDADGNISVWALDDAEEDAILAWVEANYASFDDTGVEGVYSDDSTVVFEGLDFGYYFITSSLGTAVTIDSAAPEVTVYDKNEVEPTDPEKSIVAVDGEALEGDLNKSADAHVGSVVDFKITAKTTNWTGSEDAAVITEEWELEDTFTNMTLLEDSFVVKFNDTELTEGTDYTLTVSDGSFVINVPMVDEDGKSIFDAPVTDDEENGLIPIEITYSAQITQTAGKNPAKNEIPDDFVEIYTYGFKLSKVDEGGEALKGAQFQLLDEEGNALTFIEDGDTYTYYNPDDFELAEGEEPPETTDVLDMTENTTIYVVGLDNKWDYTLTEITVPAGYNKCDDIDVAGADLTKIEEGIDLDTLYPVDVENKAGSTLPSTGGIGTTIFYVVGGLLAVGAGVVLVTKKRMGKEEA